MDNKKTGTVDPELRLVVAEALKTIPGFEALMAEAVKRSTDANQNENHKEDKEGNKEKMETIIERTTVSMCVIAIVSVRSFVVGACDPSVRPPSHL